MLSASTRRTRIPAAGCTWALCAALSLTLVTGCTSNSAGSDAPDRKSRPAPANRAPDHDDPQLAKRVQEALRTETIDDNDLSFVESGLESVRDGIHAQPDLTRGTEYEVVVACAGKGKASLAIGGRKPMRRTLDCDGVPVTQRISGSREEMEINTVARSGAVGMIGWRISKVAK
ncbi:hypothetical protein [Streptomyces sp. NRRL B-1347]|uniref:hypothetical protein n=1 Tax=Streptomyces sp. NRRL B-1347 TaxID=1476877 RepID=UPI0006912EC4|nr:hypothetical protein [Streptomyces sp. NRRL B-1347]